MFAMQLLHSATGQPPQERLLVAICGITKLFVGDLVETGVFLHGVPTAKRPASLIDTHREDLILSSGGLLASE